MKQRKKDFKKIINDKDKSFGPEDRIAECRSKFAINYMNNSSLEDIKDQFDNLLKRFEVNKTLNFSDHSKQYILNHARENLKLTFDYKLNIGSPDKKLKKISNYINLLKNDPIYFIENISNTDHVIEVYNNLSRCDISLTLSDHLKLPKKGLFRKKLRAELYTSPCSCFNAEHAGMDIMAHEFGHHVSLLIASDKKISKETLQGFRKLRQCSNENMLEKNINNSKKQYDLDLLTTEEDTADLVSIALSSSKEVFKS